jgi:methionyl-tRNA formyltransferase
MSLDQALFLAAYTSRSQAYAQAMTANGFHLKGVLLFGKPKDPATHVPRQFWKAGLFLPDLRIPLEETCSGAHWPIHRNPASDVNHPAILEFLQQRRPSLVIYSGYGGQIVKEPLLELKIPFLHVHSGWLPDECGSTTIYYRLLIRGNCAASAFILTREIDAGPILARKEYPPPPAGMDIDLLYDGAIRADLLIEVLKKVGAKGQVDKTIARDSAGTMYYVIHPVLKHLAILSIKQ